MKLPHAPGVGSEEPPVAMLNTSAAAKMEEEKSTKKGVKKEWKKEKPLTKDNNPTGTSAKGRTFAENSNWNPGTLSDKGSYCLPSFDPW